MKASIPDSTHSYRIGECPACRYYLNAEVDVRVAVGPPTVTAEGKAAVHVTAKVIGLRVLHDCHIDRTEDPA